MTAPSSDPASIGDSDPDAPERPVMQVQHRTSSPQAAQPSNSVSATGSTFEDLTAEKRVLEATQRATLNILQDYAEEKSRLEEMQKAVLNILEDMEVERQKVTSANLDLMREVGERRKAEDEIRRLNEELERRVRLRTQQLEQVNKELEAFAYSVSHDLRSPLRSLDGFSQLVLEDYANRLPEEGRDSLRRIRAGAQRMGRLIDDLLDLSRLAKPPLHRTCVDLSAVSRAIIDELHQAEPHRHVHSVVASDLIAQADASLMEIALRNLLGNAWKFTAPRAVAEIEVGRLNNGHETSFFVRDNGVGFDMAHAARLFDPFVRLHAAAEFPGSGIGLAIVQRIIGRHGGRIWPESSVDNGTTLFFTIPEEVP